MIYVKNLTFKEFERYANNRACDGNWDLYVALTCAEFMKTVPKRKLFELRSTYNERCEKYFQDNLHLLWNLEAYPDMQIDIETGEIKI